jgi:hypothetical protein
MKKVIMLVGIGSLLLANQSNSIGGQVNAGGNVNITQSNYDSNNLFASSNNETIKKVLLSQKLDYPSLNQAQYNAMVTLASESLKIDATNKSKQDKVKECKNLGFSFHTKFFNKAQVGIDFINNKCSEFFQK